MASKEPVRVLVPGAAGQIELVHKFARGYLLGADQPVILHFLDIPSAAVALNGWKKELVDGAFPLLVGVVATTDVVEACTRVNFAVVDVGISREKGTEAKDFMLFYKSLALALGLHAAADLEIWAVGDPANAKELFSESSIPVKNITSLARLDHYLAERLNVPANRVENANICGNCPSTSYPDTSVATVKTPNGEKSVDELDADDARIDKEFIIKPSERSSAMSAASSARDHSRDWVLGNHEETLVSMGEDSDGSHSLPAGGNGTRSNVEDLGTPTPAIFRSEVEGKFKQKEERLEMISNRLKELENRAGTELHYYLSRIDEFERHANRALENVCNKVEFLGREIKQTDERLEMISNQLKELENRAGTELHYYSSRIDEFERHANRAFENVCNKVEFLERESANLQANLATAQVYLHRAFQEVAKWRQLYWNLRSRVIASRVSIPVPHAA